MSQLSRFAHASLSLIALTLCTGAFGQAAASTPPKPPPTVGKLTAKVTTSRGPFTFELHAEEAPVSVTNFCHLARNGFFDGTVVNTKTRVYRIMGPALDGFDPGYRIRREFSNKLKHDRAGRVGVGRAPQKSDAIPTQFSVTVKEQPSWNLDVPIFGTIIDGQTVVNNLDVTDRVLKVEVVGDPSALFEHYADRIKQWDAALKQRGWKPGGPPPSIAPRSPEGGNATPPTAPDAPNTPAAPKEPTAPGQPTDGGASRPSESPKDGGTSPPSDPSKPGSGSKQAGIAIER